MPAPFRYRLSDREKDALLTEQAALIERLAARVAELEALLAKPKKTSRNSHIPPSQDRKPAATGARKAGKRRKPRPSRPGAARPLSDAPDETIKRLATACPHCAADVSGQTQTCRHRYDHIDLPPIAPVVTRIELFGGRCAACGRRFRAAAPDGMAPGSPFGASIRSLLLYLHHGHHVGFERLSRMMAELFGLAISEGAIANAGQRELAPAHQVCLAHVLRDVQYAIDGGDTMFAPRLRELLRWAIRIGRRRDALRPTTLRHYRARADRRLDALVAAPAAHPAGRELQTAVKAWRTKFFVFLEHPDVPPTNNACEREIRPSVVFRKVTGGFRSHWGAQIHAGYRSVTGTARLHDQTALQAISQLLVGTFKPSPAS